MILLSISDDLTDNFRTKFIPFIKLAEYTKNNHYSSSIYKSSHRNKDNIDSLGNLLIYDFDDGVVSISDMISFLKRNDIGSLICTTKSHQKVKGKKPAVDRFRLFLPLSDKISLSLDEYSDFYMYMAELLNINKIIDISCKNPSRSYFPNENQISYMIDTGKIFHTSTMEKFFKRYFLTKKEEEKKLKNHLLKVKIRNKSNKLLENEVSEDTFIELKSGESYPLYYFNYLNIGETIPCRCLNPTHEDRNPSAFIGRSNNSGALMIKCSGCNSLYFVKKREE